MTAISIPDERWLHCEIKSVSLLGNVLAKQQAVDAQVDEVVQFRDGFLTEGSSTNIWVVSGGKLLAPPKNNLILEGIRYGLMGELAAEAGISSRAASAARKWKTRTSCCCPRPPRKCCPSSRWTASRWVRASPARL